MSVTSGGLCICTHSNHTCSKPRQTCGIGDEMRERPGLDVRILSVLNTIRQAAVRGDTRPMQEGDVNVLAEDSPSDQTHTGTGTGPRESSELLLS